MMRIVRVALCLTLCIAVIISASSVCFASTSEFYLENATASKNRVFDVSLKASGCRDIAAFMCEITFDADAVEYKGISCVFDGANTEVYADSSGVVRCVFLCEESVDCTDASELITFKFKALKAGDHIIDLSVWDVIDSKSEDVYTSVKSGCVSVEAYVLSENDYTEETKTSDAVTDVSDLNYIQPESSSIVNTTEKEKEASPDMVQITEVEGDSDSNVLTFVIMTIASLVAVVGFVAYKIGALASKQKTDGKKTKNEK